MSEVEYDPNIGKELFNARKFDEAARIFEELINNGMHEDWVFNLLGHCYLYLSKYEEATQIFEDMKNLFPEDPRSYVGKGRIYDAQQKYKEGRAFLENAHVLFPESLDVKRVLLWARFRVHANDQALSLVEEILDEEKQESVDRDIGLLHIFGLIYEKMGQIEKSAEVYQKIQNGFPRHHLGYAALANLHTKHGSLSEALISWKKARMILPDNPHILRSAANCLMYQGRHEEANKVLLSSGICAQNPAIYTDVIRNLIALCQEDEAASYLYMLLHDFPELDVTGFLMSLRLSHHKIPWLRSACNRKDPEQIPAQVLFLGARISDNEEEWLECLALLDRFQEHKGFLGVWANHVLLLRGRCFFLLVHYDKLDSLFESMEDGDAPVNLYMLWINSLSNRYLKNALIEKIQGLEERAGNGEELSMSLAHQLEKFCGLAYARAFALKHAKKSSGLRLYYLEQSLLADEKGFGLDYGLFMDQTSWSHDLELLRKAKYMGRWGAIVAILGKSADRKTVDEAGLICWYNMLIEAKAILNILSVEIIDKKEERTALKIARGEIRNILIKELAVLESLPFSMSKFLDLGKNHKMVGDFAYLGSQEFFLLESTYERVHVNTYVDFNEALLVAREIRRRIQGCIPTSMVRLGDGEGSLLLADEFDSLESAADLAEIQDLWWGTRLLNESDIESLSSEIRDAILNADILGIPAWTRIVRDLAAFRVRPKNRGGRGIVGVREGVQQVASKNVEIYKSQVLTSAHVAMDFNYWNLYPFIFENVEQCTVISSHSGLSQVLSERFGFKRVDVMRLPGEYGYLKSSQKSKYTSPYPERHQELLESICPKVGELYLVAAGVLGKLYCQRIKERGGIAFDVGAVMDYWLGLKTRSNRLDCNPVRDVYRESKMVLDWKKLVPFERWRALIEKLKGKQGVLVLSTFRSEQESCFYVLSNTVKQSNSVAHWKYETMHFVYADQQNDTESYAIIQDKKLGGHKILRSARLSPEDKIIDTFFAYPVRNERSQIQCIGVNKLEEKIFELDDSIKNVFYPIKDIKCQEGIRVEENSAYRKNGSRPTISIVMAYYQRKEQLAFTLQTIAKTTCRFEDFELIIIDDVSSEAHKIEDLVATSNLPIKLISLTSAYKREKNYVNPCIPYNIALGEARGEITILQNPEVCHVGDLLQHVMQELGEREYMVFPCINLANEDRNREVRKYFENEPDRMVPVLNPIVKTWSKDDHNTVNFWYSHGVCQAAAFHFLTAIRTEHLVSLGGFLEDFAFGFAADDNELVHRIRFRLKLDIRHVDWSQGLFGIHQWHPKFLNFQRNLPFLHFRNRSLLGRLMSIDEVPKI